MTNPYDIPDDFFDLAPDEAPGASLKTTAPARLYPGDTGTLPAETRQLLVNLLRGPYFERSRSVRLWEVLKANEKLVRERLCDLYLDLLIDDEFGVAFCRRPDLGDHEAPSLLNTVRLRFLDSAMLLELRDRLMRARAGGERAVVTKVELAEMLRLFDRAADQNAPVFQKHFAGVLKRLTERRILLPLKSGDAMEISPVLPLLFPTADIESLRAAYVRRMLNDAASPEEKEALGRRYEMLQAEGAALESTDDEEPDASADDAEDALDDADMKEGDPR